MIGSAILARSKVRHKAAAAFGAASIDLGSAGLYAGIAGSAAWLLNQHTVATALYAGAGVAEFVGGQNLFGAAYVGLATLSYMAK